MNVIETMNIGIYNITNDAANNILKKKQDDFRKMNSNLTKIIKKLKGYQSGSGFYTHTDILSKSLHNPFILEKAANDVSYWLVKIYNIILDLLTNVSAFTDSKNNLKEFVDNLSEYCDQLPNMYHLRRQFLDQVPKNINYDEMDIYNKSDWLDSLDTSMDALLVVQDNLNKIDTMIELLCGHVERLKIYKDKTYQNNTGDQYLKNESNIEKFLKYEIKIHTALQVNIEKMTQYSIIRFADLSLTASYIRDDIERVKGELWK